jgi:hypothetical protein
MTHANLEKSPKKTWSAPSVTVIDLRSAQGGASSTVSDAGSNHKS